VGEYNGVYQRAGYYDIVFRRDVSSEVDFLTRLFEASAGRPLTSMVDIACGPAYHARAFFRRGVAVYGLDLMPEMVAFARDQAGAEGVDGQWVVADMRHFALDRPVDMALNSYDSIDCLLEVDDIVDHFRAVAQNLAPGGLYVLEQTHPRDCTMWNYGAYTYRGQRDGTEVEVEWAPDSQVDLTRQVISCEVVMRVRENGTALEFRDRAHERFTSPQEYVALAKLSGALTVDRFLGDFRDQPFDNSPASRRLITVLRKTG
jgi:SAM-dependent methyltransferase